MTLYQLAYVISKFIFSIVTFRTPLKAYGQGNIPKGGAVICSNHAHNSDPFYIVYSFQRQDKIWIMAKEEIRHYPVVGKLLDWLGFVIWVKRGKSDVGAVKSALKALKGQEKLLIFPEGTRHAEIGEGKTGAAMMAIRTGVPSCRCTSTRRARPSTGRGCTSGSPTCPSRRSAGPTRRTMRW